MFHAIEHMYPLERILDNVVLSPHIAGTDSLGVKNMGIEAAKNIIELSRNNWPDDSVVNGELKNNWSW